MSDEQRKLPTPAQCEVIFRTALKAGDARGVEAALMCLAVQNPRRAENLLETLRFALSLVTTTAGEDPQ